MSSGVGWLSSASLLTSLHLLAHSNMYLDRHRVLAELLEQGTRSNLTIPSHAPQPSAASSSAAAALAAKGTLEIDSLRALGINPSHALQHAGFYYYMAAKCTEKRRERFLILSGSNVSDADFLLSGEV